MNEEETGEKISSKIEVLNPKEEEEKKLESLTFEESITIIAKKKRDCYFPSAHLILLILELIIF